ncbi:hypothetical protein F0562_021310 [Nyssa sinensis]|uniref:Uncharacterized protein n=1 Tax=Nyssa sinensis TaxID=561372 RepID=A0A5J5BJ88_9ASTE|nr:hypothetical protein F0562_021310 [Nyssa sinensis]
MDSSGLVNTVEAKDDMVEDQVNQSEQQSVKSSRCPPTLEEEEQTYTPLETRQNICRTANAVRVLSTLGFSITVEVIMETVNLSNSLNLDIHEMLGAEFCVLVAEGEAERRSLIKKKRSKWVNQNQASSPEDNPLNLL